MKKQTACLLIICYYTLSIILTGCRKKDGSDDSIITNPTETINITITGMIRDEQNNVLPNVMVTCNGITTTTSGYGTFSFTNISVPKSRFKITYSKPGYFDGSYASFANSGQSIYVNRVMLEKGTPFTFQSATGGTINLTGGASIQFPPNAYKVSANGNPYNGTITVYAKHLCVDSATFFQSFPGNDLSAVETSGESKKLVSFGMVGVEMYGSSGEKLNLSSGTAQISMPVATSQISSAASQIKMWYFDESTMLWKEEGAANLTGNNYVGNVSHFSWWNCDQSYFLKAFVKGRVLDCDGNPIQNAYVTSNVVTQGSITVYTDAQGVFMDSVAAGNSYTIMANVAGYLTGTIATPNLSVGQSYTCPDIILTPCPGLVRGRLLDCNGNPANGIVICNSANGLSNYQNTINSEFSLFASPNAYNTLSFYRQNNYYTMTIPAVPSGQIHDVGSVTDCNSIGINNLPENTFIFDGGPFSNYICTVDSFLTDSFASAHTDASGHLLVNFSRSNFISMAIQTADSLTGNHSYSSSALQNYFNGNLRENNSWYYLHTDTASCSGNLKIIEVGSVGGRVKGTIEGTIMVNPTQFPNQNSLVNVTGKFNAKRN